MRRDNEDKYLEERVAQLEAHVEELLIDMDARWADLPVDGYQGMEDEDEHTE